MRHADTLLLFLVAWRRMHKFHFLLRLAPLKPLHYCHALLLQCRDAHQHVRTCIFKIILPSFAARRYPALPVRRRVLGCRHRHPLRVSVLTNTNSQPPHAAHTSDPTTEFTLCMRI
jgi:hypothetical protein